MCEYVVDIAEKEAEKRLTQYMLDTISLISDEIIATAEECESQAPD